MTPLLFYASLGVVLAAIFCVIFKGPFRLNQEQEFAKAIARAHEIYYELERLIGLQTEGNNISKKQLDGSRRKIARAIRKNCGFLTTCIWYWRCQEPQGDKENEEYKQIQAMALAALRQVKQLYANATRLLFLIYLRPRLARDCKPLVHAVEDHSRAWIAYLALLKRQYPERYANLNLPDENSSDAKN